MYKLLNLIILLNFLVISCDNSQGDFEQEDSNSNQVDSTSYIRSTYIRTNFYQNFDRISDESMSAYNDLIMIAFRPYTDGSIYFDLPDNQASFSNVDYQANVSGRSGVMDFQGDGAEMNGGPDLINKVRSYESDGSFKQFSFGTWLYIDQWTPGAYIFKKTNSNAFISCMMGDTQGTLIFNIDGNTVNIHAPDLLSEEWHHFALAYHGGHSVTDRVAAYIDGIKLNGINIPSNFPTSVPFIRAPFYIGIGLDAKLDETFVHNLYLSGNSVQNYMNNGIDLENTDWNSTKTLAYWTYNDQSDPGKDAQSWQTIYNRIRSKTSGTNIKLRLGMAGGDWKTVFRNSTYRNNFVNSLYNQISDNGWDGIDLDFEWCSTAEEFNNYSNFIVLLSDKLKPLNKTFSVSLHPVSYKISQTAIDATDFISLQIYGPRPYIFPYDEFVTDAKDVVNYGVPKNKLVLGVPFFGVESNGEKLTQAYLSFVDAGLITSPEQNEVLYNGKSYIFNGQNTIQKKAHFVRQENYLGIMSWDIATDAPFVNNLSLTKTIYEELNK